MRQAEEAGFEYSWFFDSHILWRDSYVTIAMCIEHTQTMRFGPCVTNPGVRDWSVAASLFGSLAFQSNGRFDIGVGRGDSSLRVMGKKPANLSEVVDFCDKVRSMVRGAQTIYADCPAPVEFPWATGYELPIFAEPMICKWLADQTIKAGVEKKRDMEGYQIMAAAPAYIGSMDHCVERTKWFPAMVGNHVADIVERYGPDSSAIPASLAGYIEKRRGYDYQKHGQSDNPFLDFITPDVVADFAVLGSPDQHIEKLRRLKDAGITQFNIYIDNGEEEKLIAEYGKTIIPALRD